MNEIKPAVAAAIFNTKREILLQKRADVDKWGLISGHVEFGETVQDAVIREIWEETNAKATIIRLIGVYSSPASQTYYYKEKNVQYVTSYFEARFLEDVNTSFFNDETKELKFFGVNNLPRSLAQMDHFWLSDALAKDSQVFVR